MHHKSSGYQWVLQFSKVSLAWALTTTALIACGEKPAQEAYDLCQQNFQIKEKNQTKDLQEICLKGVDASYQHILPENVQRAIEQDENGEEVEVDHVTIPSLQEFRHKYIQAKAECVHREMATTPVQQMACLDGVDIGAAVLARGINYDIGSSGESIAVDETYYQTHHYYDIYDDFDDNQWMYTLLHRVFFPEYYPSYRRDWIYRNTKDGTNADSGPDPQQGSNQQVPTQAFVPTSQPTHSNFSTWWIWYNHIYNTSSATQSHSYSYRRWSGDRATASGSVAGTGPQGYLRFGPSAEPRPFKSGSPWFAPQRPGTAGFYGSTNVTHPEFTAGSSYRGTTANAISAARGSSSVGIRGATISRGGFGSHFGGGGS